jgi:hypothetical protein
MENMDYSRGHFPALFLRLYAYANTSIPHLPSLSLPTPFPVPMRVPIPVLCPSDLIGWPGPAFFSEQREESRRLGSGEGVPLHTGGVDHPLGSRLQQWRKNCFEVSVSASTWEGAAPPSQLFAGLCRVSASLTSGNRCALSWEWGSS